MTAFVDGPLWNFALIVFLLGIVWRLFAIFKTGSKPDYSVPRRSAGSGAVMAVFRRFLPRRDMAPKIRVQLVAGYLFHLGLFALLLFAAPHVLFLEQHLLNVN